jgi:probable HAF family extracellular repeat protein
LDHIPGISRSAAARRALVGVFATCVGFAACDEQLDLPTSPSIANRTAQRGAVVGANVTILPTLGGPSTTAVDINDNGLVVGSSSTGQATHAFLWSLGIGIRDLGTLGGPHSLATAINNAGQVVGSADVEGDQTRHAFLWTAEKGMQDLGTLGGTYSSASAIDDKGRVFGVSDGPGGGTRLFLWTPDRGMQDLTATLGLTSVIDVNNAGQMAGTASVNGEDRAFLWTPGEGIRDLGTLGGEPTVASALNEAGWVVGFANTNPSRARAFVWTPRDGMRDLGTPDAARPSFANDVNDLGQIVGSINTPIGKRHAFLWTETDGLEDLIGLTGMASIAAINNRGQVVGDGRFAALQFLNPNRAPVVNMGGPYSGTEGTPVTFAFSATDADGDALSYSWDLGDGTGGSGLTLPASHTYADNGTYVVTLSASDGKSGTDMKSAAVSITNIAPTIPTGGLTAPLSPIGLAGGSASAAITVSFTDPAGPSDTYAAQIQCGNGTTLSRGGITSPYSATCVYTAPGVYTVSATVSDDDGGTSATAFYEYISVLDTDGAFVTGAGFYDVPGQGAAKAHFSFDVNLLHGQTPPNGSAKLWMPIHGEHAEFESTTIEMLVVAGNRAQFWGTGTLNGEAARFRITATDDGGSGAHDAVRIELWHEHGDTLLYDSQPGAAQDAPVTTTIEGGKVHVHGG